MTPDGKTFGGNVCVSISVTTGSRGFTIGGGGGDLARGLSRDAQIFVTAMLNNEDLGIARPGGGEERSSGSELLVRFCGFASAAACDCLLRLVSNPQTGTKETRRDRSGPRRGVCLIVSWQGDRESPDSPPFPPSAARGVWVLCEKPKPSLICIGFTLCFSGWVRAEMGGKRGGRKGGRESLV
ncbi:hypothetical protein LZ30DRAFT_737118 [Colletotrichum cereale]|nr:hypothetical protein LZ30DRAFT_737118 [Colletotrichum cereale]